MKEIFSLKQHCQRYQEHRDIVSYPFLLLDNYSGKIYHTEFYFDLNITPESLYVFVRHVFLDGQVYPIPENSLAYRIPNDIHFIMSSSDIDIYTYMFNIASDETQQLSLDFLLKKTDHYILFSVYQQVSYFIQEHIFRKD